MHIQQGHDGARARKGKDAGGKWNAVQERDKAETKDAKKVKRSPTMLCCGSRPVALQVSRVSY